MKNRPAKFLLNNSKGHPDFVMTMLVAVMLCLFVVLLYWMMLNIIGLHLLTHPKADKNIIGSVSALLANFNENSQIIIIGICSSIFSLAGSYYLRRASFDKHHLERKKMEFNAASTMPIRNAGLEGSIESSIGHPNFDDNDEDI